MAVVALPPRFAQRRLRDLMLMSFHANLRLAAEGSLLAVTPRSAALAVRDVLGLKLFRMEWGGDDTDVTLVWREANLGNPALVAFLECF